jgi:hypothetical protein
VRDARLQELLDQASGPFPDGLAGEEIDGVDLALLDMTIHGVASHYPRNSRPVSDEHRAMLTSELTDLDRINGELPTQAARDYFDRTRAIARYLLHERPGR